MLRACALVATRAHSLSLLLMPIRIERYRPVEKSPRTSKPFVQLLIEKSVRILPVLRLRHSGVHFSATRRFCVRQKEWKVLKREQK